LISKDEKNRIEVIKDEIKSNNSDSDEKETSETKKTFFNLFRNTPMIYIKCLSELTGCNIYAKCEYFLPYTSKDRMIKNIIETSIK